MGSSRSLAAGASIVRFYQTAGNTNHWLSLQLLSQTFDTINNMSDVQKRPGSGGAPASKKRKADKDLQKYYAVRTGLRPGVYLTWLECQKQTTGFPGATCKTTPLPFPLPPFPLERTIGALVAIPRFIPPVNTCCVCVCVSNCVE